MRDHAPSEVKIINRNSPEIQKHRHYARFSPFIRFLNNKNIHFPISTVELANLRLGHYVHFVKMDKQWFFYCNTDPKGFKLFENGKRDTSLRISSAAFIDYFFTEAKIKEAKPSFYVQKSTAKLAGYDLFEIQVDFKREDPKKR